MARTTVHNDKVFTNSTKQTFRNHMKRVLTSGGSEAKLVLKVAIPPNENPKIQGQNGMIKGVSPQILDNLEELAEGVIFSNKWEGAELVPAGEYLQTRAAEVRLPTGPETLTVYTVDTKHAVTPAKAVEESDD